MKKKVGIVPPGALFNTVNLREDTYTFGNNYGKRITECGGIPLGILPIDGVIDENLLEDFDSFLICGGTHSYKYHFQIIHYAIKTGKPLLGICLGMQTIHRTFKTLDFMKKTNFQGDVWDGYIKYSENQSAFLLEKVENHRMELIRGCENDTKHKVKLLQGSNINKLTGKNTIMGASFHSYRIVEPSEQVIVSGVAEDGTIEVIEYGNHILGLQFHPEIDQEMMPVFEMLCK